MHRNSRQRTTYTVRRKLTVSRYGCQILAGSTYETSSRPLTHGRSRNTLAGTVVVVTSRGGGGTRLGRSISGLGVSARETGPLGGGVGLCLVTVILFEVRDMTLYVCCGTGAVARFELDIDALRVGNPPSIRFRSASTLIRWSSSFLSVSSSSFVIDTSMAWISGGDRRGERQDGQA